MLFTARISSSALPTSFWLTNTFGKFFFKNIEHPILSYPNEIISYTVAPLAALLVYIFYRKKVLSDCAAVNTTPQRPKQQLLIPSLSLSNEGQNLPVYQQYRREQAQELIDRLSRYIFENKDKKFIVIFDGYLNKNKVVESQKFKQRSKRLMNAIIDAVLVREEYVDRDFLPRLLKSNLIKEFFNKIHLILGY